MQEKLGAILSTIDETLGGIRIIKAFNAEKKQLKKFTIQNDELFVIKNKANRKRDSASPVSEVLGVFAIVCVLWFGGRLVLRNLFRSRRFHYVHRYFFAGNTTIKIIIIRIL